MMNAIVKPTNSPGLELRRVPIPEPGSNEVLIKIHKTSICGTDIHIYNWDSWAQQNVKPPYVIGHEYVGEIYKLGNGCTKYKIGQRVSGEGHITCGVCNDCLRGDIQFCPKTCSVGVNRDGAFAEYLCIPEKNVIPIDETFSEEVVSFFDAFGNATHASLQWDLTDKTVIVTGAGPIGCMACGICKFKGCKKVVITDVNEYRLDLAVRMGADVAVNVSKEDLNEIVKNDQELNEGFDIGLEMSGNGPAFNQMISVMKNGGSVSLLGLSGKQTPIDMNQIILKGLRLQGIYGRKLENWDQMKEMVRNGFDLSPMITHRFHFSQFQEAFKAMSSGKSGKVVIDWTDGSKNCQKDDAKNSISNSLVNQRLF